MGDVCSSGEPELDENNFDPITGGREDEAE